MARTGTVTTTERRLRRAAGGQPAGQVALIRRGTCGFYNKAFNAQTAGAAGVVLYNNVAGRINPTVAPVLATDPPITIPVVAISDTEGALIDAASRRAGRRSRGPDQLSLVPKRDGAWISRLQLLRPRGRPEHEAGHRRARRLHPFDLSAGEGRLRKHQRHLDGLAARRGRGRAAAAGESVPRRPSTCRRTAQQRGSEAVGGQPGPGLPRQRPSSGRGHGRHRRCDSRDDAGRTRRNSRSAKARPARDAARSRSRTTADAGHVRRVATRPALRPAARIAPSASSPRMRASTFSRDAGHRPGGAKETSTSTITPATAPVERPVRRLHRVHADRRRAGVSRAVRRFRRRLPGASRS